jgi:hypothetical protein
MATGGILPTDTENTGGPLGGDNSGGTGGADPNPITDPTGGQPNFNIEAIFQSFGYTPSQAEINALSPAFEGRTNVLQTGTSAVAEYVQAHQELAGAQSQIQGNLLSEQEAAKNSQTLADVYASGGQAAYDAAAQVFTQAPKLFGSLTADQITQYLQPAQDAFNKAQGTTTGAMSARGLGGSSIESQALSQNLSQFMTQTLMTGLGIGQQQQANQAGVLQNKGAGLFGLSQTETGVGAQYQGLANASAANNATLAGQKTGLAGGAVNEAIAQEAAIRALNPQSQSFGGQILSGLESAGVQDITNLGQNLVGSIPGLGPLTKPGGGFPGMTLGGGSSGVSPTGAPISTSTAAPALPDFTSGLA